MSECSGGVDNESFTFLANIMADSMKSAAAKYYQYPSSNTI